MVLSIGVFFSLMIAGLSQHLPSRAGAGPRRRTACPPPTPAGSPACRRSAVLFAAFLGYNPIQQLLGPILSGAARRPGGLPHRPQLLPAADLRAVRRRPDGRVLVRHRRLPRRRRRLVVRLRAQPRPAAGVRRRRAGREQRRAGDRRDAATNPRPAELMGAVRTVSGATVLDGVVTVTDAQGTQRGRSAAAPNGRYAVGGLLPGDYTAVASSPGFRPDVADRQPERPGRHPRLRARRPRRRPRPRRRRRRARSRTPS